MECSLGLGPALERVVGLFKKRVVEKAAHPPASCYPNPPLLKLIVASSSSDDTSFVGRAHKGPHTNETYVLTDLLGSGREARMGVCHGGRAISL